MIEQLIEQPQVRQAHLWPEAIVEANGFVTASAAIELANGARTQLWYRLPAHYRDCLTTSCDSFIIATIFLFMSQGVDVMVHGEVSPSLLRNLEEFQAAWSAWRPQLFQRVEISVETGREQPTKPGEERAISSFSGGVDSCFTAFRHHTDRCGWHRRNLVAGLMVHGFDIPLKDHAFEQAAHHSSIMLASLEMECIPLATNFREAIGLGWEDIFGAGIASCLHLLKGGYSTGIIASSHAYQTLNFIYGSNPLTDRLLSSEGFEIVHDGAMYSRIEKIQAILDWPEALEHLRVCWQGKHKDRNCGRCEKCVRNILNFRIMGADLPPCFEEDVGVFQIATTRLDTTSLEIWETLLSKAKAANIRGSWLKAVEVAIMTNRPLILLKTCLPKSVKEWIKVSSLKLARTSADSRQADF
jgi:hypothetical protein